jgi:hypothetical protein
MLFLVNALTPGQLDIYAGLIIAAIVWQLMHTSYRILSAFWFVY